LSQPTSKSEIEKLFPDFKIPHIAITEEIGRHDIETFIEWSINKSTKLSRALKDETKRISTIKKIALATKGSFESEPLDLEFNNTDLANQSQWGLCF
jgi:hypothetical protein